MGRKSVRNCCRACWLTGNATPVDLIPAFAAAQLREKKPETRYYGALAQMSVALSSNVVLALVTAVSQLTVGFVRQQWSTVTCIALAGTSVSLVVYLTVQLMLAHREWFEKIEREKANLS
jgi:hypothetical protein